MKTVHIIQSAHSNTVKKRILGSKNILTNVEVLSFKVAFNTHYERTEIMVASYNAIESLNLKLLKDTALNSKTIKSALSMLESLNLLGISLSALPMDSPLDQEIALILQALDPLLPKPTLDEDTHYVAYDHFLSIEQKNFLNRHNIEIQSLDTDSEQNIRYFKTLNFRHELEGAFQDILNAKVETASFVIPNLKNHIPLIETVLKRYGKDIQLEDRSFLLLKKQFTALLKFATTPSIKHLKNCLDTNAFNIKDQDSLIFLLDHFNCELPLPETLKSSHKDVSVILEACFDSYTLLKEVVIELQTGSLHDKIIFIYTYLTQKSVDVSPMKSFIEKNLHLFELKHMELLLSSLNNLQINTSQNSPFKFYDLNDFDMNLQENVYALNLSAKNYPGVNANTGIFDESYLKRITNYPSLQSRTTHTISNKACFLRRASNLTLSYSFSNYEGKGQEPSYAIETFAKKKASVWPIQQIQSVKVSKPKLSTLLSQALFLEDGLIKSNISALQIYTSDPMKFFMNSGLRLREPELPQFDARSLGVINHSIVENLNTPEFEPVNLWQQFPSNDPRINMIRTRNLYYMEENVRILKESLSATVLQPQYEEMRFNNSRLFNHYDITGVIDRVDLNDTHFMVVDYKSSAQSLNERRLKSGEQLQLLTYAYIMEQKLNKKLLAVYYYSFNTANTSIKNYDYSKSVGVKDLSPNPEFEYLKKKRYSGWLFDHVDDLFYTNAYHGGIIEKKVGRLAPFHGPRNKDTVKILLQAVYDDIYKSILAGNFDKYDVLDAIQVRDHWKLRGEFNVNTI